MKDAGSGMSVIGHSLIILQALGVDMTLIGLKQGSFFSCCEFLLVSCESLASLRK